MASIVAEMGGGPVWQFNLGIAGEYIPAINDIIRMVTIQIVSQLLFHLSNPIEIAFLTNMFFQTLLYMMAGISTYWLIVRKLIGFVSA